MQSDPLVWVTQPCTGTPPAAICASASAFDPTSHTLYVIAEATFALDVARWVSVCGNFFFSGGGFKNPLLQSARANKIATVLKPPHEKKKNPAHTKVGVAPRRAFALASPATRALPEVEQSFGQVGSSLTVALNLTITHNRNKWLLSSPWP